MAHVWTGFGPGGFEHEQGGYVGRPEDWDTLGEYNEWVDAGGQPFGQPAWSAGWMGEPYTPAAQPAQTVTPSASGPFAAGRPTWLPSVAAYRTPKEDWQAFTAQQQPFWSTRAPMADVGQNLLSRYLIGAPAMAQQPGVEPTFRQFLEGWQGPAGGANTALLRDRAWEASRAATTPQEEYIAGAKLGTPGGVQRLNQRAWLQDIFGMGAENAMTSQIGVAQMLALQRRPEAGGGVYRGRMADAIRNAMTNLYQGRINVGAPKESFLDWYLGQTGARPTA